MWFVLWVLGAAFGTEMAFQLETGEGIEERWVKEHSASWTSQFGPVEGRGKRSVRYDVTVPSSVFDPIKNGFETRVTICRYWYKGSKRGRDCLEDTLIVPAESDGPLWFGGKTKGSDKFQLRMGAYYRGSPPTYGAAEEPEPEPEPEVVEEEPVEEEPAKPEKDEMTSTLESIASQVVDTLGDADDEPSDDEDEDEDDDEE